MLRIYNLYIYICVLFILYCMYVIMYDSCKHSRCLRGVVTLVNTLRIFERPQAFDVLKNFEESLKRFSKSFLAFNSLHGVAQRFFWKSNSDSIQLQSHGWWVLNLAPRAIKAAGLPVNAATSELQISEYLFPVSICKHYLCWRGKSGNCLDLTKQTDPHCKVTNAYIGK